MYTIHDLCRISRLSRSTILYYDSLGLLKPAERSASNYRFYSDESLIVLGKICLYRDAGVSLADIGLLLNTPEDDELNIDILEKTLFLLNNEARQLREKQHVIIDMIKTNNSRNTADDYYDDQYHVNLEKRMSLYAFTLNDIAGRNGD